MSFESFSFGRTIPPTVQSQSPASSADVARAARAATEGSNSVAAALAAQISNLIDTAIYLQSVILSLNTNLGVSVDPSTDPNLASALSLIYNGQVPPAISLSMYSYTLDAELGCSQVNLAAGTNSPVQANPFQYQALLTVNKAVESSLATSGNFGAQSALLLRRLKSDVVSNTSVQSNLLQYPAATPTAATQPNPNVITASTVDVSPAVAAIVQSNITQTGQVYSSMNQVLTQPDPIAADVGSVVNALTSVAIPDLIRMNSLLNLTQAGSLTQALTGLSTGLSAFVYSQMLSQSSGMLCQLDKIMQMAVTPAAQMSNAVGSAMGALSKASSSVGSLVGVVRSMKKASATQTTGPLAGMPLNNSAISGLPMSSALPASMSNLGLSSGISELSSLMQFSISSTQSANSLHQDSFQRLSSRVNGDSGSLTQVLAASSSITSLTSLTSAFINEQQNGSAISTQDSATQLATVSRILASSQTGNGTTYTVQNGTISLTPPSVPAPTPGASAVFAQSGIQTSLAGLTSSLS